MTPLSRHRGPLVLLGPQRKVPTVREHLDRHVPPHAPIAVITAGWEEREREIEELGEHVGRAVHNLELFRRAEEVFAEDPDLRRALQERHDRHTELQSLYKIRLRHLVPAAQELLERDGTPDLLEWEREAAFDNLRALDRHHVERVLEINRQFVAAHAPHSRPAVRRHLEEVRATLRSCAALCIAGGHVGILFNRLWLFAIHELTPPDLPVIAWSAGAMAIGDRIVLFHDNPPEGAGHAEVLGPGIHLYGGVVPLPHARKRLRLDDKVRVQLLARRFADAVCPALDEGTMLSLRDGQWEVSPPTRWLTGVGTLQCVGGEG